MTDELSKQGEHGMQTVLRMIPMPADLGVGNSITTGWLLAKLDQAGAVLPGGYFGKQVVLVHCNAFTVKESVQLGDCVSFQATIKQFDATGVLVNLHVFAVNRGDTLQREIVSTSMRYEAVKDEDEENVFMAMFRSNLDS